MRHLLLLSFLLAATISQAQSYKKLHNKSVVVDTHNDVLSTVILEGLSMETDLGPKAHSDLKRFKEGGVDVQIFSVFCDERFGKGTAFKYANREIDSLYAIIGRNPDKMMLVTDVASFKNAVKQKKLGSMIGVEGGHMIEDNLTYLDSLYKRGTRYLTLTWNNSTSWATSAWDETRRKDSLSHLGLNDFGRTVVRRMNELGMLVDVSHVGERTFWDVMQTTTKPVIASHSCAHALCPVPRNLKDDQIKAIGKNGGVIHLNFYSGFVDSNYTERLRAFNQKYKSELDSLKKLKWVDWEIETWMARMHPEESQNLRPSLSQLLDHLDHIVKLVGVDHVGLGSDFDGISSSPKELDDVSDFPNITKALVQRGYSKKDIRKILGENFIRVFKANHH